MDDKEKCCPVQVQEWAVKNEDKSSRKQLFGI